MKKLNYIIIFFLLSYIGKIFSGQISEIKVPVSLNGIESALIYSGTDNRNICAQFGLSSDPADSFCRVNCNISPQDIHKQMLDVTTMEHVGDSNALGELCQMLQAVPLQAVVESCEKHGFNNGVGTTEWGLCFKKSGDVISSSIMTIGARQYKVILIMSDVNIVETPEYLLHKFKEKPCFFDNDFNELLDAGILAKEVNKRPVHGPNGYGTKRMRLLKKLGWVLLFAGIVCWFYFCK
jgi:hypothetical protein